jgi:Ca2+-binding EF-hand superfamily protein
MTIQLKALTAAIAFAFAGSIAVAADKPMDGKNNDGKLTKKEASNASRSDESGFAKMDKNKDGYISKTESMTHKELSGNFAKWDMNNDGKLNRAEYLAAMAKHDAGTAVDKVTNKDDKTSSTGGSSTKPKN